MNRCAVRSAIPAVVVCAAAVLALSPSGARADAGSDLEKAHSAYVAHKYDDAEKRLRALLDPTTGGLKDPDAVADARMYLGAVLIAEGKRDQASDVFEQLLLDRPDYQPDPLRVSLPAIDALIDARTRLRDRLEAIASEKVRKAQQEQALLEASKQRAAQRQALLERLASEQVVIEHNSRFIALVPFGAGQFQNRQPALAWMFLSSELVFLAGSVVGSLVAIYNVGLENDALGRRDATAASYGARAQTAAVVGDTFAGAFAVSAAVGIIQAELTFVPEYVEIRKRVLPPISIAPIVGPGALGLRATF